ncbi:MAG: hypothetical protein WC755_01680 [Candidatus Woesearchaeota archaeon]|jgi:hypothetical protein
MENLNLEQIIRLPLKEYEEWIKSQDEQDTEQDKSHSNYAHEVDFKRRQIIPENIKETEKKIGALRKRENQTGYDYEFQNRLILYKTTDIAKLTKKLGMKLSNKERELEQQRTFIETANEITKYVQKYTNNLVVDCTPDNFSLLDEEFKATFDRVNKQIGNSAITTSAIFKVDSFERSFSVLVGKGKTLLSLFCYSYDRISDIDHMTIVSSFDENSFEIYEPKEYEIIQPIHYKSDYKHFLAIDSENLLDTRQKLKPFQMIRECPFAPFIINTSLKIVTPTMDNSELKEISKNEEFRNNVENKLNQIARSYESGERQYVVGDKKIITPFHIEQNELNKLYSLIISKDNPIIRELQTTEDFAEIKEKVKEYLSTKLMFKVCRELYLRLNYYKQKTDITTTELTKREREYKEQYQKLIETYKGKDEKYKHLRINITEEFQQLLR